MKPWREVSEALKQQGYSMEDMARAQRLYFDRQVKPLATQQGLDPDELWQEFSSRYIYPAGEQENKLGLPSGPSFSSRGEQRAAELGGQIPDPDRAARWNLNDLGEQAKGLPRTLAAAAGGMIESRKQGPIDDAELVRWWRSLDENSKKRLLAGLDSPSEATRAMAEMAQKASRLSSWWGQWNSRERPFSPEGIAQNVDAPLGAVLGADPAVDYGNRNMAQMLDEEPPPAMNSPTPLAEDAGAPARLLRQSAEFVGSFTPGVTASAMVGGGLGRAVAGPAAARVGGALGRHILRGTQGAGAMAGMGGAMGSENTAVDAGLGLAFGLGTGVPTRLGKLAVEYGLFATIESLQKGRVPGVAEGGVDTALLAEDLLDPALKLLAMQGTNKAVDALTKPPGARTPAEREAIAMAAAREKVGEVEVQGVPEPAAGLGMRRTRLQREYLEEAGFPVGADLPDAIATQFRATSESDRMDQAWRQEGTRAGLFPKKRQPAAKPSPQQIREFNEGAPKATDAQIKAMDDERLLEVLETAKDPEQRKRLERELDARTAPEPAEGAPAGILPRPRAAAEAQKKAARLTAAQAPRVRNEELTQGDRVLLEGGPGEVVNVDRDGLVRVALDSGKIELLYPGQKTRRYAPEAAEKSRTRLWQRTERPVPMKSKLREVVETMQMGKREPADVLLKRLRGTAGVKAEELEVSGLREFLEYEASRAGKDSYVLRNLDGIAMSVGDEVARDRWKAGLARGENKGWTIDNVERGKVSRDDLIGALEGNPVRVHEVIYDDKEGTSPRMPELERASQEARAALMEARTAYESASSTTADALRGPATRADVNDLLVAETAARTRLREAADRYEGIQDQIATESEAASRGTLHPGYVSDGGTNYREFIFTLPDNPNGYTSGHWSEENPVAHLRVQDVSDSAGGRTDAEGYTVPRRGLRIEELQSDWARNYGEDNAGVRGSDRVPFISGGKWQEFVLKRALKLAVDEGYDYIEWVTGKETADRYSLEKQIDSIDWKRSSTGTYDYSAKKDGHIAVQKMNLSAEELSQHLGKDVARKILEEAEARDRAGTHNTAMTGKLSGVDLAIGGEWAKTLYDQVIPNTMRKLTGQKAEVSVEAGAVKELKLELAEVDKELLALTAELHTEGLGRDRVMDIHDRRDELTERVRELDREIEAAGGDVGPRQRIDITPELREKIKREGVTLFQTGEPTKSGPKITAEGDIARPKNRSELAKALVEKFGYDEGHAKDVAEIADAHAGVMAGLYGGKKSDWYGTIGIAKSKGTGAKGAVDLVGGDRIIHALQSPDRTTALHEFSHIFLEDLRAAAEGNAKAYADLKTLAEYAGIEGDPLKGWGADPHEVIARAFEKYIAEGKQPTAKLKAAFERMAEWITQVYSAIKGTPLERELTPAVREAFDGMLKGSYRGDAVKAQQKAAAAVQPAGAKPKRRRLFQKLEPLPGFKPKSAAPPTDPVEREIAGARLNIRGKEFKAGGFLRKGMQPLRSRLRRIDQELGRGYDDMEVALAERKQAALDVAAEYHKVWKGLGDKQGELENTLLSSFSTGQAVADKAGIGAEYRKVRGYLETTYQRAKAVGMEIGYLENYWPRVLEKPSDLDAYLRGKQPEAWGEIQKLIAQEQNRLRDLKRHPRDLTAADRERIITEYLMQYQPPSGSGRPGFTKERQIPWVDDVLRQFYKSTPESLVRYIETMETEIAKREWLGGKGSDPIAETVDRLLTEGKLSDVQAKELRELLRARFSLATTNQFVRTVKGGTYLSLIGQFKSTMTQLKDQGTAMYEAGLLDPRVKHGGAGHYAKALFGKKISLHEMAMEDIIADELRGGGWTEAALKKNLQVTRFSRMDKFGKEVMATSAINRLTDDIRRGNLTGQTLYELKRHLGEDYKTSQAYLDMKAGKRTPAVARLASKIVRSYHPVDRGGSPQFLLEHPNTAGLVLQLKTFQLSSLDAVRRETLEKMQRGGKEAAEGVISLARISALMMMAGATVDTAKDFLYGRKFDLDDKVFDNLLQILGLSKFALYSWRREGPGEALMQQTIDPPARKLMVEAWQDGVRVVKKLREGDEAVTLEDIKSVGRLPVLGDWLYWHKVPTAITDALHIPEQQGRGRSFAATDEGVQMNPLYRKSDAPKAAAERAKELLRKPKPENEEKFLQMIDEARDGGAITAKKWGEMRGEWPRKLAQEDK